MRKQKQKWVWLLPGGCCWPDPNPGPLLSHPQAGREGLRTWAGEKLGRVLDDNGLGDQRMAKASPCSPGRSRAHERWPGGGDSRHMHSRTARSTGLSMQQTGSKEWVAGEVDGRTDGQTDGLIDGQMDV